MCNRFDLTKTMALVDKKIRKTKSLVKRGVVLFLVGVFLALILNLLQVQRNITLFPAGMLGDLYLSAWWVPPVCGTAAVCIGLMYPCVDVKLGEPLRGKCEWSNVIRCLAVFVGINHASAKMDFANNLQFSLTLAAMSLGLWWFFDRSRSGFGLSLLIATIATIATQLMVYKGFYRYTEPDFLYVRSWLPCVFFSGGVTIGNIGRQLAIYEQEVEKEHSS